MNLLNFLKKSITITIPYGSTLTEGDVPTFDAATGSFIPAPPVAFTTIQTIDDLEPYLSGNEFVLPENELILIEGTINIGNTPIVLSEGTVLRGLANGLLISSNATAAVRIDNATANVVIREINIVNSVGSCLSASSLNDVQLNVFFVGMIGANAAVTSGFDVQSFKQCYFESNNGINITGACNKLFVSECVFYSVVGSAITFDDTLVLQAADIVSTYFKFDAPGTAITAEAGYTVNEGKLRGSLIEGTATPLSGLSPADVNWTMTDNTRIRDSRIAGEYSLTGAPVATTIGAAATPVKLAGATVGSVLNERFTMPQNNRLEYTGRFPALIKCIGTVNVATGNNVALTLYIAQNGVVLPESETKVRVGSGQDQRYATVSCLTEMNTGDYIEIWVENDAGTESVTANTLGLSAFV